MSKLFVPKPMVVKLGNRQTVLRVGPPKNNKDAMFPVLMASVGTTLHVFLRSGEKGWLSKDDAKRRRYLTSLVGPENLKRIVMHNDIDLRLEMDNQHFIMRNRDVVEVFSLRSSRLVEYLDFYEHVTKERFPIVKELVHLEHVLDDIVKRNDVWNSYDLCTCLAKHPTVDATHRIKVAGRTLQCSIVLRTSGVSLAINFNTDGDIYSIGRGELRINGGTYHYNINASDGLTLISYGGEHRERIEKHAEVLIRKLVAYVTETHAESTEPA